MMRNKKRPVLRQQWKLEINQFHPINHRIQLKINRSSIIYTIPFLHFNLCWKSSLRWKRKPTVTVSNGIQLPVWAKNLFICLSIPQV